MLYSCYGSYCSHLASSLQWVPQQSAQSAPVFVESLTEPHVMVVILPCMVGATLSAVGSASMALDEANLLLGMILY